MSQLVKTGSGIYFQGDGQRGADYFCGRCGRILAVNIDPGQIANLWLTCSSCLWLNGFDVDLGWATYVVRELQARRLSIERVQELVAELRDWRDSTEAFLTRNPDVAGGALRWFAQLLTPQALLALLTLLATILIGKATVDATRDQAEAAREQVEIAKQQGTAALTAEDVRRLAAELHRLQEEVRVKPPPQPPRKRHARRR
jgi:hypothetical protein